MKKIFNLLFISLAVIFYSSCTPEEDDLFEKSSAQRIEEAIKMDTEVLTSAPNGWLMEYYPSSTQEYGGYTVLVSFSKDGKVTVASDVFNPDKTATSTYILKQSAGVILSFDTYNEVMHFFSDPANPAGIGINGKGMEGDFEFNIMEVTAEKVVLKGRKTGNKIIMTPLSNEIVWKDLLYEIQQAEDLMYFPVYKYTAGNIEASVSPSYRNLTITYEEDGNEIIVQVPYIVTPTGFKLYETLNIGGIDVDEFIYKGQSGESDEFASASGKAQLKGIIPPLNETLVSGDWYFAYSKLGSYGQKCWNQVRQGLLTENETLYYVHIHNGKEFTFGSLPIGGSNYYKGILGLDYEFEGNNTIKIDFNGTADSNGGYYFTNVPGFQYILYPLLGIFELTTDNIKNPTTITMVDKENPTNVITLQRSIVYYPDRK